MPRRLGLLLLPALAKADLGPGFTNQLKYAHVIYSSSANPIGWAVTRSYQWRKPKKRLVDRVATESDRT